MATTTAKKPAAPPQSRRNRDKETLYKPGSLHKWFAFFSVLLVLAWVWMIWADYDRAWKDYQRAFFDKQLAMAEDAASDARREVQGLDEQLPAAKRLVKDHWAALSRNKLYAPALDVVHELEKDVLDADTHQKGVQGLLSPARFQFEKAKEKFNDYTNFKGREFKGYEVTQSMVDAAKQDMLAKQLVMNKFGDSLFEAQTEYKMLSSRLSAAEREVETLEAQWTAAKLALADIEEPQTTAEAKLKGLEALYKNNQWRNFAFADFISPTLTVRQNVLKDIHDNWNFATNVKVDRCITCHLGVDMESWGKPENIHDYKIDEYMQAHSGFNLIAGKKSPHKVERFGCSVCHHGVGWATDFTRAAHTPMDAAEKARWKKDHDFGKVKHVEYPMIPVEYVQGQCWKCHKSGMFWPVGYEETLDHGFFSKKDAVSAKEVLAQTRFDARIAEADKEDPDARAGTPEDRILGPHEVWGKFALPPAPAPFRGSRAKAVRAQWDSLVAYYGERKKTPVEWKFVEEFATESTYDYKWDATKYELGYDTVTMYGCQGCHTISDFGQQVGYDDPPRMGPNLTFSGDKLNPDFIDKWIKYPEMYRVDTKMPSFFWFTDKDNEWNYRRDAEGKVRVLPVTDAHMIYPDLAARLGSNTTSSEIDLMNLQVVALKAYLLNLRDPSTGEAWTRAQPDSAHYNPRYTEELPAGDADRGRELVNRLGCIACHVVPEIRDGEGAWVADGPARFDFDPNLMRGPRITAMGSKTNAAWMNAWLADPRHYTSSTRMPDMRITDVIDEATGKIVATADQQRSDIITYLLGHKDAEFDALPNVGFLPSYEKPLRDMYESFFGKTSDGDWKRRSSLDAEVSVTDPTKLGTLLAAVGEKLMARNGCFGCHEVAGHEKDMPIGVELTREGVKDLHQLDFGAVPKDLITHTRQDFFFNKLRTPRVWDWAKVKVWQDKLRMPRFNFRVDPTPEEEKAQKKARWTAYKGEVDGFLLNRRIGKMNKDELKKFAQDENERLKAEHEAKAAGEDAGEYQEYVLPEYYQWMLWPTKPEAPLSMRKSVVGIVLGLVDEPIKPGILHDPDDYERDIIEGRRVMKRYGCNNCHTIEGQEGYLAGYVTADERKSFKLEKAAMPPNLFAQGLRTRTEWLVKFLKNPKYLRPLAQAHMPRFGFTDAEATAMARYFVRLAGRDQNLIIPRPDSVLSQRADGANYVQAAEDLFNAVNCNKCHLPLGTPGADPEQGGVAPPFSHSPERLRYLWVQTLLYNPLHLIDGTKMPAMFTQPSGYGRSTPYKDHQVWLKDDPAWQTLNASDKAEDKVEAEKQLAEAQMLALTDYLLWHYRDPASAAKGD